MTQPPQRYGVRSLLANVRREALKVKAGLDAVVPCGTCTACCWGYNVGPVGDETARACWRLENGTIPHRDDGSCIHLVHGKCTIYQSRPRACRVYDCRTMSVAGILPVPEKYGKPVAPYTLRLRAAIMHHMPEIKSRQDMVLVFAMKFAMIKEAPVHKRVDAEFISCIGVFGYQKELAAAEDYVRNVVDTWSPEMLQLWKSEVVYQYTEAVLAKRLLAGDSVVNDLFGTSNVQVMAFDGSAWMKTS